MPTRPSESNVVATYPARAPNVSRGRYSDLATPTKSCCAATRRSALNTSGRCLTISSADPTCSVSGKRGSGPLSSSAAGNSFAARPSSVAMRCRR